MPQNALTLIGMLVAVVAVLALAYFATRWVARRGLSGAGGSSVGSAEDFCILRQISVGRSERLLLVRLNGQCMLLGVTGGSITVLKELTPEESALWLKPKEPTGNNSFWDVLKANLPKKK